MANIRSVSLYSYQEEFFFGRLSLEGMIEEVAKTGARGIELLAEQYVPDEYADPSETLRRKNRLTILKAISDLQRSSASLPCAR